LPILTVELIGSPDRPPRGLARAIADATAPILGSEPNGTWVRLRALRPDEYAENGDAYLGARAAIVTVLAADPPSTAARAAEAELLCAAIAEATDRDPAHVHLIYDPPARGRVAFGGRLLE
jgi:phenylpyruvate tautomerase PptA (4-oxalocrotonate tautomerase family)